jgi:MFS family permease
MGSILSSNIGAILRIFGSSYRTILFCLGIACLISISLPFVSVLSFYWMSLVAASLLSLVAPLTLACISKQLPDQDQGTLMGANEALFNFGGVVGPLLVLFTFTVKKKKKKKKQN